MRFKEEARSQNPEYRRREISNLCLLTPEFFILVFSSCLGVFVAEFLRENEHGL